MLESGNRTFHRKKITISFFLCTMLLVLLFFRLVYLMVAKADYYAAKAIELHERERSIKAARGRILDCNGTVIADNKTVCTISVIYSQIEDKEAVIDMLCRELGLSEEYVRARVEKYSSIERIKSNVDKETGDRIREYDMAGVKVDEDYKRYYPYGSLASKVLGFTGSDNQGIIGLEVIYDEYLEGEAGTILTVTDARGIEVEAAGESRIEPIN
ncbi:MAG: peptidoglycan glycosyltransferase, partial [Lachnospiraceae bacterium]|nr:peptidoglycan glycosyltransferase [Lachnospiraceae bacterium]